MDLANDHYLGAEEHLVGNLVSVADQALSNRPDRSMGVAAR
jgi:hypothetical protein